MGTMKEQLLCYQNTSPAHFLDLPLSLSTEELGLDDDWLLWQHSFT